MAKVVRLSPESDKTPTLGRDRSFFQDLFGNIGALVQTNVKRILERSCYDCHSNRTRWPWYSHVAPVSWLVARDVHEGREEINFSEWPMFDFDEQDHLLEQVEKQVKSLKVKLY